MEVLLSVIVFLVILSVLVLAHEWGHFAAARRAGITVEEFGFGLPPRVWGKQFSKKGTLYSINAIPFGGFVKMKGEDEISTSKKVEKDAFGAKSWWQRTQVILAGVTMNFALAWVLLSFLFTIGVTPIILSADDMKREIAAGNVVAGQGIAVLDLSSDGSAAAAGVQKEDKILSIDGAVVITAEEIIALQKPNLAHQYQIARGSQQLSFSISANAQGKIGAALSSFPKIEKVKEVQLPFLSAVSKGFTESVRLSAETVRMFGKMVSSMVAKFAVPEGISGPVGIAEMTHDLVKVGDWKNLIKFTALLSVSLAVLNVMPFPALDGGRFLFLIVEAIRRKPVPAKWETWIHQVGYLLLLALIVVITWRDVARLIFG